MQVEPVLKTCCALNLEVPGFKPRSLSTYIDTQHQVLAGEGGFNQTTVLTLFSKPIGVL